VLDALARARLGLVTAPQSAPACDNPECDEACRELHPTAKEVVTK
jgi:hypothetical protein